MGRPKGSKTKKPNAYAGRTDRVRAKHGKKCYRRWGKRGGNPVLLNARMATGIGLMVYPIVKDVIEPKEEK